MSARSKSFSGSPIDAETTAELPVLDIAAHEARHGHDPLARTDSWAAPTVSLAVPPQLASLAPELTAEPPKSSAAAKLEVELRAIANNLSDLETRLAAKGERLTIIESELADSRAAGQAQAQRAAALSEELAASRDALVAATAQIDALQATIRERDESVRVGAERETELRQSMQRRAAEIDIATAASAAQTASVIAGHELAVQTARQQVVQLQAQSAAQLETLQSMEGRRGIFDSILRALDIQIDGRAAEHARVTDDLARNTTHSLKLTHELDGRTRRVAELEAEVAALNAQLTARASEASAMTRTQEEFQTTLQSLRQESAGRATRVAELEAQLVAGNQIHAEALRSGADAHSKLQNANAALVAQQAKLEAELVALRAESAEHVAAVQQVTAEHANRMVQIQARDKQIAELTAQVETQAKTIHSDAELRRTADDSLAVAENDLRVAEEAVNRLEADVRSSNMRVEELTQINTQMQAQIADAQRWLGERDSLMQRLETEAAHSAALVDNIQRSIRSLEPSTPSSTTSTTGTSSTIGTTGTHEAVRDAGTRLLVRSKDGHEVVHVLGRKTTIGRTPDNDLQIDASFVSRHHAVLLINGQQTVIEDLNSTNGVHVNGQRVSREILTDGDIVSVGKARFRFVIRPAGARSSVEPSA
jgi:chromosome segregation ATPase